MIPFILMTAFLLCFIWLLFYELSRLDRENKSIRAELEKEKESKVVNFDHDREQQPAEWSEEDLQHKSWILECLADGKRTMPQYAADFHAAYNWLKSLRPQSHWKPSEEQMCALKYASTYVPDDEGTLAELYEQLKKL